jgi:hypothetical protein
MEEEMYIVFSLETGEKPDLKAFERRSAASSYAKRRVDTGADTADVYEVDAADARAAKAGLEMGAGRFVEAHGRRATEAEIQNWLWTSVL